MRVVCLVRVEHLQERANYALCYPPSVATYHTFAHAEYCAAVVHGQPSPPHSTVVLLLPLIAHHTTTFYINLPALPHPIPLVQSNESSSRHDFVADCCTPLAPPKHHQHDGFPKSHLYLTWCILRSVRTLLSLAVPRKAKTRRSFPLHSIALVSVSSSTKYAYRCCQGS